MSKKHKKPEKEPNHERWLLTYSDLITLLMIFFVIMYAMSNVDIAKYQQMAQSFGVAMGGGKSVIQVGTSVSDSSGALSPGASSGAKKEQQKLSNLKKVLDKYLNKNGLSGSVATEISERGLEVNLTDTILFDSGKAEIKTKAIPKLVEIGRILNSLGNTIRIEGHTDNVPISNSKYPSNWDLSVARATTVTKLFISMVKVAPQKLSIVGNGEFRPRVANDTEAHRAQNRRVNIIILDSKYSGQSGN
jgi:chemotaxis protein MotB